MGSPNTSLCCLLSHAIFFFFFLSFSLSFFLHIPRHNPQSIAFLLYTHIVFLITLYATSGRNASDAPPTMKDRERAHAAGAIELTATPTSSRSQGAWYSRVRSEEPMHVIGENDEGEDEED
jgi:hypothetical protein